MKKAGNEWAREHDAAPSRAPEMVFEELWYYKDIAPWRGLQTRGDAESGIPSGCGKINPTPGTGGLRFAATPGYSLSTLRVAVQGML